jgi:hypothetical protein
VWFDWVGKKEGVKRASHSGLERVSIKGVRKLWQEKSLNQRVWTKEFWQKNLNQRILAREFGPRSLDQTSVNKGKSLFDCSNVFTDSSTHFGKHAF